MGKFIGFMLISLALLAQEPLKLSFNHLDQEGGLSNTNVFAMHHDQQGFMWLGTINGLTRFDGINCVIYKPNNSGIRGIAVKSIVEDKAGNLWLGTEVGLNFFDRKRGTFTYFDLEKQSFNAVPFHVDHQQLIWLTVNDHKHAGTYTFDKIKRHWVRRALNTGSIAYRDLRYANKPLESQYLPGPGEVGIQKISYKNNKVVKTQMLFDGSNKLPAISQIAKYMYLENDSILWVTGYSKGLKKLNTKTLKYEVFEKDNNTFTQVVPYLHYLIMGSNNGIFVFNKSLGQFVQQIQYSNANVFGPSSNWSEYIHLDTEGNFFLSNLGPGIDYTNLNRVIAETWLNPEASAKLGYNDNKIQHIVKGNNEIYAKYQNGPVMVLDFNGNFKRKYAHYVIFITDSESRQWLFNGKNIECHNPKTGKIEIHYFKEFDGRKGWEMQMVQIGPKLFLISSPNGVFEFDEMTKKIKPLETINKEVQFRIKPMYYDNYTQQVFLMSSWWSDFYAIKKIKNEWKILKELKSINAYGIRPAIDQNYVWLCTRNGLLKLNTKNYETQKISENQGLPDNFVTDIIEESSGNFYVVTGRGIAYYDKKTNTYQEFTSRDGIYAKEIDWNCAFKLPDGRAVFGGTNGINIINKSALTTYPIKPKIQITQLLINEKIAQLNTQISEVKKIKLAANQNSFGFKIIGISYGFPQKIKLKYMLEGFDKNWITVENGGVARYNKVPEGSYTFKVASDQSDQAVQKVIAIYVAAPFYLTTWFRALLLSGFVLLGYLLYRLRTAQIRKDERKKEEIRRLRAESEVNSLRSQMNPHFIFNSLNTVDSYILRNKTDEASEYLNKFSRLIRMILENSREDYIPLSQDLEALELYINLEQERFHSGFKYMIKIDEQIKANECQIPPTLIQPFVENAILHGLKNKKTDDKVLKISIEKLNNRLEIQIDDNGVGRAATAKRSHNKQSLGMTLTADRIQKLNESFPDAADVQIIDKPETEGLGTTILLTLPLITKNQVENHESNYNR